MYLTFNTRCCSPCWQSSLLVDTKGRKPVDNRTIRRYCTTNFPLTCTSVLFLLLELRRAQSRLGPRDRLPLHSASCGGRWLPNASTPLPLPLPLQFSLLLFQNSRRRRWAAANFRLCFCVSVVRALDLHRGRQMRRLSLRPGEAAVLAQALVLWAADACVYSAQEVRGGRGGLGPWTFAGLA